MRAHSFAFFDGDGVCVFVLSAVCERGREGEGEIAISVGHCTVTRESGLLQPQAGPPTFDGVLVFVFVADRVRVFVLVAERVRVFVLVGDGVAVFDAVLLGVGVFVVVCGSSTLDKGGLCMRDCTA